MRRVLFAAFLLCVSAGCSGAKGDYAKVKKELEALKPGHPWAGVYNGLGGMSPTALFLAPSGRYCVVTFWDMGPSESGYCGRLTLDGGVFHEGLWSRTKNGQHYGGPPYVRISWGERKYLVPEKRLIQFINDVNEGREPRVGGDLFFAGSGFLLEGGNKILVVGAPDVPAQYRSFVLRKPLLTAAVEVTSRTVIITQHDDYKDEDCRTDALFGAGASSGVFVGMSLHALTSDALAEAEVKDVWVSSSAGRIRQFNCDETEPIPAGTPFSSRPEWSFNDVLSTAPLTISIRHASSKRFPPFPGGSLEHFFDDESFRGAAAQGFSWEETAEITFAGAFHNALRLEEVKAQMDRALLLVGGNAYLDVEDKEDALAKRMGVAEAKRRRVLRLSYRGKAIDPQRYFALRLAPMKPGKRLRYDWGRAALSVRAGNCGQFAVRAEAESVALREALRGQPWTEAITRDSSLMGPVWERGRRAESDYEAAHPGEAAVCRKLMKDSRGF